MYSSVREPITLRLSFDEGKFIAVLSHFINLAENRFDKYKAAKLMYLFDREMFLRTGIPAFFGEFFSLEHGPIVSEVNDAINSCRPNSLETRYFSNLFFNLENTTLSIKKDIPFECAMLLSDEEQEIISEIFTEFGNLSFGELKAYMHDLPETIELEDGKKSAKIPYSYFLKKNGFSEDQIGDILSEVEYENKLREILSAK